MDYRIVTALDAGVNCTRVTIQQPANKCINGDIVMDNPGLPTESRLCRVSEVATHLGLSRSGVYQLMDAGRLAYVKLGRSRRIPLAAVEALVKSATVGASGAAK